MYRFGSCEFDPASRSLSCRGIRVALRGKVSELLVLLLEQPGAVIPSDTLRERLWPEGFVETGNLAQQIYLLRKALAVDPLVHTRRIAHVRAQSGVLLEYRSWAFMIAFPHDTPSTSNAPGLYVKWPVPAARRLT